VAVITAHGNTDNAVTALKAGAFDYINKPVTLEQLRALVKSALKLPGSATVNERIWSVTPQQCNRRVS
jgi:Response regulator containing CheY-like receiver, AAA-type ATPase, and DNA-binding domains